MAAATKLRIPLLDPAALSFVPRGPQFVDLVKSGLGAAGLPGDGTDAVIDRMFSSLPRNDAYSRAADHALSPAYSSVAALSVYTGHDLGSATARAIDGGDKAETGAGQLLPTPQGAPAAPSPPTMGPPPPVATTPPGAGKEIPSPLPRMIGGPAPIQRK